MNSIEYVSTLLESLIQQGASKEDIIRTVGKATVGWPYVFGAWGEECTPANRKRRARADHPTITSKCPALNGRSCSDCPWGIGVRMFDCRGFTAWLLRQVGLDIAGQGATTQYNTTANWAQRGRISDGMPDVVCCLFRQKDGKMEHTGMHLGGGVVVDGSVNVRSVGLSGWTHYGIPMGLYGEGEIPVDTIKPTLRRGNRGTDVVELQDILTELGYNPGSVDGIFGTKTFNALVAFQTDAKLDPDGVCGPKTWKALAVAEAQMPAAPGDGGAASGAPTVEPDEVTYRVTVSGVTWAKYRKILEICPLAEVEKESR